METLLDDVTTLREDVYWMRVTTTLACPGGRAPGMPSPSHRGSLGQWLVCLGLRLP